MTQLLHQPLRIGTLTLPSPIILAPMAGVTNTAFRVLCQEIEQELCSSRAGLYICEMITARAWVENNEKTRAMVAFGPEEQPRSLQFYAVDPHTTHQAITNILENDTADHIDLNFGCPVPKVTRLGGGAALPSKRRLFRTLIRSAIAATEGTSVPVTVKMRVGIDDNHHTFLDAGKIAEDEGAAAITLHARTAQQRYSGHANWSYIRALKQHVKTIPVIGNGDIFTADDAFAMHEQTNCDGIMIGRGCLGRPWLFAEINAFLHHGRRLDPPDLAQVGKYIIRHARLLSHYRGQELGIKDFRKHIQWYLRGFAIGGSARSAATNVSTLSDVEEFVGTLDNQPFPLIGYSSRGRQGSPGKVHLPDRWLDDPEQELVSVTDDGCGHEGG